MGNSSTSFIENNIGNPFFAPNRTEGSQGTRLLAQFKLVSSYEDNLFKTCSVIEHKQTGELIIVKQMDCENEQAMQKMYSQFQRRRQSLSDQNILRLRYVLKKKSDGMFSDQFKIVLFFDYVLTSLDQQAKSRKIKSFAFTVDQINMILFGTIKGYAFLQQNRITNDKVRLKNIYFGLKQKNPFIKVIDSKLFPTLSNFESVRTRQFQTEDVFLAPQQLQTYSLSAFDHDRKTAQDKAGVFSLGMIMMQLCLLTHSKEMYDYQSKAIDYRQMQTRLNIIKNKYPLYVFYMIRQMLERTQESRPSFTKLYQNLPTNVKNLSQNQRVNLSIVNASTTHVQSQRPKPKILPPTGYTKLINPTVVNNKERTMHNTTLVSQYRPAVDSSEVYTNGNMYTGQKKDNLRHGKGKYIYNDASYYYGDWFKGRMEGQGQLYDSDGNLQYQGQWKQDHYHGKGTLFGRGVDWQKYEGQFVHGKIEGFGQMIFKDGNRYKGQFRNDVPWGKGRMFLKNGAIQAGIWDRGNFTKEI